MAALHSMTLFRFTRMSVLSSIPIRTALCRSGFPQSHASRTWQRLYSKIPHITSRSASQWGRSNYRPPQYNRFSRAQQIRYLWATSPRFRLGVGAAGAGGGVFYYSNLETVPVSGRSRFNCISAAMEEQMGQEQYQQLVQELRGKILPAHHPYSKMVDRVMQRLIPVSGMKDAKWEVRVINDPEQKNAFVLPGGKVFVYSGILPICGGDDGLAAVLGHEISHNYARHTGEKLSRYAWLVPLGFIAAYTFDISGQMTHFLLSLILEKPNSRAMESEADYIGLLMMAQACYNPKAAVGLWERMAKEEQYASPQLLSTHPASKNRTVQIREWIPEAEEKQAQSQCGNTTQISDQFRQAFGQKGDFF